MYWRIFKYIQHLFHFRKRKGHGIHSPYQFEFINRVLFNSDGREVPPAILKEHRRMKRDKTLLPCGSVRAFVLNSSVSEKYASLLYRISQWFHPDMILELGTGLGISTIYLSAGSPETPLHSIEGNMERAAYAAQVLCRCCPGPVSIHWGDMDLKLEDILPLLPPRFLAFVDGNHQYEPTIAYVRLLVDRAGDEAVIVMDDIYWSKGMFRAWTELISWPEVRVSINLFHTGILLLRKDLYKTNYKIKF